MEQKEPTQVEIREFWEQCGLRWFWDHNPDCKCGATDDDDTRRSWYYKEGSEWRLATRFWKEPMVIDLNNLFKCAIPKLKGYDVYLSLHHEEPDTFMCAIHHISEVGFIPKACRNENPALALFWAIREIILPRVGETKK